VSQMFGSNANIAFGDGSAAGNTVDMDNSTTSIDVGDIAWGNTTTNVSIADSFNDFSTHTDLDLDVNKSFNDLSTNTDVDVDFNKSFNDLSTQTDLDVAIEDSFTSEIDSTWSNSVDWENSGNLFSPGGATTGGDVNDIDVS
jgi:prepilin-type processing-associated H-X9-DG protein